MEGWRPPGWLTPYPPLPDDKVMDGWGARPLRWLSVLVTHLPFSFVSRFWAIHCHVADSHFGDTISQVDQLCWYFAGLVCFPVMVKRHQADFGLPFQFLVFTTEESRMGPQISVECFEHHKSGVKGSALMKTLQVWHGANVTGSVNAVTPKVCYIFAKCLKQHLKMWRNKFEASKHRFRHSWLFFVLTRNFFFFFFFYPCLDTGEGQRPHSGDAVSNCHALRLTIRRGRDARHVSECTSFFGATAKKEGAPPPNKFHFICETQSETQ